MRILFVCTGNICRSPMAEGLFRHLCHEIGNVEVFSGGIGAIAGQQPSKNAITAMKDLSLDISSLRSKPVTPDMIRRADYVLVMTYGHLDTMLMLYPEVAGKLFLLREFEPGLPIAEREVSDPIGGSEETYRRCRDQIHHALKHLFTTLQNSGRLAPEKTVTITPYKIAIGADHGGYNLKAIILGALEKHGHQLKDLGCDSLDSVDYPDYARAVVHEILSGHADFGILICKSGIGMSIAANKYPNIRAALIHNVQTARLSRQHNNANVLCLSADELSPSNAQEIVNTWLMTEFTGGRHQRRIDKMETLDAQPTPSGTPAPPLSQSDPDIFAILQAEHQRQFLNIELIASENFTSRAVMEAQGSCLTNKYAEGYPAKRWYGGCEEVDKVEQLAIDRAKELFGADHANVQPHSGSQANMAVYFSVLQPGDKILTMDLAHGGHLTHGHKMNFSGRLYEVLHYGVNEQDETIHYDELAEITKKFKPKMITVGASAYSRTIHFDKMRQIADLVGAYLFADMAHIAGLVAAGEHPSPVPHAHFVTTTTHKTLRGPRGGLILCTEEHAKAVDSQVFPGCQGGPLMHVIAAKAVCLHEALQPAFKAYQAQVIRNAKALCQGMKKNGYRIVSGSTDNHLMLVDLQPNNVTGKDAQEALDKAGITVNKNAVPFDKQSPFKAGGIRLGSPAVTTRGMKESEMFDIANWIHQGIQHHQDEAQLSQIRDQVRAFTQKYPLPY